ncbi:MAG TPA: acyloxyacyl hydrolase [Burkholderiales bacterium]|nr:acyloxyacyl hydrolase [Burkholderiales bacterium]
MKKIVLLSLLFPTAAFAIDGVSVEAGNGMGTDMMRVGAQWDWHKKWFDNGTWHLGGYWDASVGEWRGHAQIGGNQKITDFGLTPVFRYERDRIGGFAPYVEAAVGFHLISRTYINADRKFSTAYQFGDHVGAGVRFGKNGRYDLEYRFQHLSNGGIKEPNQGINFNQIRFEYHF